MLRGNSFPYAEYIGLLIVMVISRYYMYRLPSLLPLITDTSVLITDYSGVYRVRIPHLALCSYITAILILEYSLGKNTWISVSFCLG